ncbi:MAG: 5-oxoprolinase subunit PxpB [Sporolactobacillus sp.]
MEIVPFGDQAVRMIFGDRIDPSIQQQIRRFLLFFERHPFAGWIEYVPAYTNIVFYYDPAKVLAGSEIPRKQAQTRVIEQLQKCYAAMAEKAADTECVQRRTVVIPVCYGGAFGPDLDAVAACHHMSPDDIVRRHSETDYLVYMLGFAPGFPFLGGLPEALATPRRAEPRLKVAAGSVGIAGSQTGVYPLDSPGGWQIIGRTPLALFNPDAPVPVLLNAGDLVRFKPMTQAQFFAWRHDGA